MGWQQLHTIIDPAAALRHPSESQPFDKQLGDAIRSFRNSCNLRQSDIPGLTERHLRRIESGISRATSKALRSLAEAHMLDANQYMDKLAERLSPAAQSTR